jgi:hypothetical protein
VAELAGWKGGAQSILRFSLAHMSGTEKEEDRKKKD